MNNLNKQSREDLLIESIISCYRKVAILLEKFNVRVSRPYKGKTKVYSGEKGRRILGRLKKMRGVTRGERGGEKDSGYDIDGGRTFTTVDVKHVPDEDKKVKESVYNAYYTLGVLLYEGIVSKTLDAVQTAGDVVGIADPTGVVDGANVAVSLGRAALDKKNRKKHLKNAAISAAGVVPYVGDAAKIPKLAKLGSKAVRSKGYTSSSDEEEN